MRVVVVGAAGQAREIRWYLRDAGHECVGFVVSDLGKLAPYDSRDLLGDETWLAKNVDRFDALALGMATPPARARVYDRLRSQFPHARWPPIIHPSAVFDEASIEIGEAVLLGAGAILTTNVVLSDCAMVNFGATIGHDTRVGRACVINPGANVSGGVVIEDGVLVGAGAVVLQYLRIGSDATVGAGAVVTRDVPDGVTVVGVPARSRTTPL